MVVELNGFVCNGNIGNKAKSLIDLHRYGFKVPTSIALDTKCYFDTIGGHKDKIKLLLDRLDFNNIEIISKQINILLSDIKIDSDTLAEVYSFMHDSDKYLLRCSVDGVDENYSYAGLFLTKRGINKLNIEENILACYKSIFSYNSLCYMLKNNIDYSDISVAVIIQKEIKSSTLGIAYTMNPVTLNTSEYLIDIVDQDTKEREKYSYDYIKEEFIVESDYKLINKNKILDTIELIKNVSSNLGYPVEIELTYTKNDIYIIQTRELSSILYENQDTIWFKEDMSSKQFMYSLISKNYEEIINKFYEKLKLSKPEKINSLLFNRCCYNILNLSEIVDSYVDYDYSFFFNHFKSYPQLKRNNNLKKKIKRLFNNKKLKVEIVECLDESEEILEKFHKKYNEYCRLMSKISGNNIEKTWINLVFEDYKDVYTKYMELRVFLLIQKNKLYQRLKEKITIKEFNDLITIQEELIDFKINKELNDLVLLIRKDEEAYRYWFSSSTLKILKNYNEDMKMNFHDKFKNFINNYGYLSYFRFDLSESFYVEDVEDVIRDIKKQLANFEVLENNEKQRKEVKEKLEKLLKEKEFNNLMLEIKQIQNLKILFYKYKDYVLRFNFIVKRFTKMLAKVYLNKKILDHESDIWHLSIFDIYNYIDGEIDGNTLSNIEKKNKVYFNSYRNFCAVEYTGSIKERLDNFDYQGIGLSTGVIKGKVRKIKNLQELKTLEPKDILVTKTINNNLLFQLPKIQGIIVSDSNIGCSVRTNIRELKIPCLILDNCSKKLTDKSLIKMDGATGYIKRVKK